MNRETYNRRRDALDILFSATFFVFTWATALGLLWFLYRVTHGSCQ
jgi:hypothetical protein